MTTSHSNPNSKSTDYAEPHRSYPEYPREIASMLAGFEIAVRDYYNSSMSAHFDKKLDKARREAFDKFDSYVTSQRQEAKEEMVYKVTRFEVIDQEAGLMAEAMLQLIHREKILTGNRIRKRNGEPEIIPDPVMYQQAGLRSHRNVEWVIDVPKEWTSLTGRMS